MKIDRFAIFISTSRNTQDVFMKLFDLNFKYLREIGLEIFIGCNNSTYELRNFIHERRLNLVDASFESNWNDEVESQVEIMYSIYNIDSFLFLLDDFLIMKYNKEFFKLFMSYFIENNLRYLRLKERMNLWSLVSLTFVNDIIYKINIHDHYYNSLQIAFWKVDAFMACTQSNRGESIWRFEWLVINENWSVRKSVFCYDHIIEKGRVRQSKLNLLSRLGVDFNTERSIYNDKSILNRIKELKFLFLGYLFSSRP